MKKVEQINSNGEIVFDYDTSLSPTQIFSQLRKDFPNIRKENGLIVGTYENIDYSILIKNVTYLGHPHPLYKKRIQISGLPDFYEKSVSNNYVPLLMGVYTYGDVTLYCDFGIYTYLTKKSHNSSAHVYTDDMAHVFDNEYGGIFEKEDYFKNSIMVFKPEYVQSFLSLKIGHNNETESITYDFGQEEIIIPSNQNYICFNNNGDYIGQNIVSEPGFVYVANEPNDILKKVFGDFFSNENRIWNGIDCYKEMIEANYKNKFQPEWAGFYLEYEFEKYINEHNLNEIAGYAQDRTRNGIDLDLYFPTINSYGDLKAHSSNSRAIQGNDWATVFDILGSTEFNNHIYYIVCEHDTDKDKDHDYKVTKFWNRAQNKANEMSYSSRMKNSVQLTKYYILDINNNNKQYLSKFRQGVNSDGHLREPKIMIDNENLDKFVIAKANI